MIVVCNSGPLISLARINQVDLLRLLYQEILIPLAVYQEVTESGSDRPGASEIRLANWIQVREVENQMAVALLRERLDQGESEAIVLAIETQANLLLIDEVRGRRIAQSQNILYSGTIGTLVLAKRRGLIAQVTPLLDDLMTAGFRMNQELYQQAKTLANEG